MSSLKRKKLSENEDIKSMTTAGIAKNSSKNSTTESVPTDLSAIGVIDVVRGFLPEIKDINFSTLEFNIDNHLDDYGSPTQAQTVTVSFMTRDGKRVRVIVE